MADLSNVSLRQNNPYSLGYLFVFDDGDVSLDPGPLNYQGSPLDRYFTVAQTDNLWNIAHQAYGDSKLWWVIAKANQIDDPFELDLGNTLIIPDLDSIKVAQLT